MIDDATDFSKSKTMPYAVAFSNSKTMSRWCPDLRTAGNVALVAFCQCSSWGAWHTATMSPVQLKAYHGFGYHVTNSNHINNIIIFYAFVT